LNALIKIFVDKVFLNVEDELPRPELEVKINEFIDSFMEFNLDSHRSGKNQALINEIMDILNLDPRKNINSDLLFDAIAKVSEKNNLNLVPDIIRQITNDAFVRPLNNHAMAIDSMYDPYTTCCFINERILYIQLFYSPLVTHYHFLLNIETNEIEGEIYSKVLENDSKKNFPTKCFFASNVIKGI